MTRVSAASGPAAPGPASLMRGRPAALLILLACLTALGGALLAQYGFGLRPCILCLAQRGPFVAGGLLAALALKQRTARGQAALLALCALGFLVNAGIAGFHVGVEQHWWEGTNECVGSQPDPKSIEDLQAQLAGPPPARCDQIPWSLFGISMAGYNIPFSLALAVFAVLAAKLTKQEQRP